MFCSTIQAVIAARSTGQIDRSSTSDVIGSLEMNVNCAGIIVRDEHPPRLTADLAILEILLRGATTGVNGDFVFLATIRTVDGGCSIHRPIAEGEVVVERVVTVFMHGREM